MVYVRKYVPLRSDDAVVERGSSNWNRAAEGPEKSSNPDADEGKSEQDGSDGDRTSLKECEGVPAPVTHVVVDALHHDDGDDGHDGNDEGMKVQGFVEMPLE